MIIGFLLLTLERVNVRCVNQKQFDALSNLLGNCGLIPSFDRTVSGVDLYVSPENYPFLRITLFWLSTGDFWPLGTSDPVVF
jgi:hypothetical protein